MTDVKKHFDQLYIENYTAVYNFIFSITLDKTTSEDLTQEAFIRAYNHIDSFRCESKISVWISQIAYNLLIDHKRKKSSSMLSIDDEILKNKLSTIKSDPSENIEKKTMSKCVQNKIGLLPENYRIPYILDMQGYSNQEIAIILNCTLASAKIRLHRARKKIKETLSSDCNFYYDNRNILC